MSKHPLDDLDVGTGRDRHACRGVTQCLGSEVTSSKPSSSDRFVPDPTAPVVDVDEATSSRVDEGCVCSLSRRECLEVLNDVRRDWRLTTFFMFRLTEDGSAVHVDRRRSTDLDASSRQVEMLNLQRDHLTGRSPA